MTDDRSARLSDKPPAGFIFIFITLLVDMLGFGIIVPVLPNLIASLTGGQVSDLRTTHLYGILASLYGLMQFFFAPVLGGLSDRFGRRPVLLVSLFFATIEFLLMANAPSVGWLVVGRILTGITGASYSAASAYIADISPPEKRAQNFGMLCAAFGIGFILGPALGGVLGQYALRAPFWAAAALSFGNALYGLFVLPESLALENRRPFSLRSANPVAGVGMLRRFPLVTLLAVSILLLALGAQSLQSTWILYTNYRYGWTPLQNGLSLSLIGLVFGGVQAGLTRVIQQWLGEKRTIFLGIAISFLSLVGFAFAFRGELMLVFIIFWGLGSVSGPVTQSIISRNYGPDEQGATMGALQSLQSVTSIAGPLWATWVFGYFTGPHAPIRFPGASFLAGAVLIGVAGTLTWRAFRPGGGYMPLAAEGAGEPA